MSKIEIKIKAYESALVDSAAKKVAESAKQLGAEISGPIPLPIKREIFTVLKSVHIHKKSREQFEMKTHKRLIIIKKANEKLIDGLSRLELPSGVKIEVKTKNQIV